MGFRDCFWGLWFYKGFRVKMLSAYFGREDGFLLESAASKRGFGDVLHFAGVSRGPTWLAAPRHKSPRTPKLVWT